MCLNSTKYRIILAVLGTSGRYHIMYIMYMEAKFHPEDSQSPELPVNGGSKQNCLKQWAGKNKKLDL